MRECNDSSHGAQDSNMSILDVCFNVCKDYSHLPIALLSVVKEFSVSPTVFKCDEHDLTFCYITTSDDYIFNSIYLLFT